jgi:hypothetical protein
MSELSAVPSPEKVLMECPSQKERSSSCALLAVGVVRP